MGSTFYAWAESSARCPNAIDSVWQFYYFDGTGDMYPDPQMDVYCAQG